MSEQRPTAKMQAFIEDMYENAISDQSVDEYWLDLLVQDLVVVEITDAEWFDPVIEAQLMTYLAITGKKIGLLANNYSHFVKDGIRRFIL